MKLSTESRAIPDEPLSLENFPGYDEMKWEQRKAFAKIKALEYARPRLAGGLSNKILLDIAYEINRHCHFGGTPWAMDFLCQNFPHVATHCREHRDCGRMCGTRPKAVDSVIAEGKILTTKLVGGILPSAVLHTPTAEIMAIRATVEGKIRSMKTATPTPEDPRSLEDRAKLTWDKDPALRAEFQGSFSAYLAYSQANKIGGVANDFMSLVNERMKSDNCSKGTATRKIATEKPEVHEAWVQGLNKKLRS